MLLWGIFFCGGFYIVVVYAAVVGYFILWWFLYCCGYFILWLFLYCCGLSSTVFVVFVSDGSYKASC